MNLSRITASPTIVRAGKKIYLVRSLRLWHFGFLLQACADHLGRDWDGGESVEFKETAFQDWLTAEGFPLLLWCGLCDFHGFTIEECEELTVNLASEPNVIANLFRAAFRRDKSTVPATDGESKDIAKLSWIKVFCRYAEEFKTLPDAVANLTLDQLHTIASQGQEGSSKSDEDALNEAQRLWEEIHNRQNVSHADATKADTENEPLTPEEQVRRMGFEFAGGEDSNA